MYILKHISRIFLAAVVILAGISYSPNALTVSAASPAFEQDTGWGDYNPADRRHYFIDANMNSSDPTARKYKTLKEAADFISLDPIDGGPTEPEAVVFVANGVYNAGNRFVQQYSRLGMAGYPNPRNGYSAVTSLAIIGQSQSGVVIDGGFTSAGERVSSPDEGVSGINIAGKNITVKNMTIQNIKPGDGTGLTSSYKNTSYGLLLYPLNNLAPVHIENCDFRYTPETRIAALSVWGMGITIDDSTSGKYYGDRSNSSVTVKGCGFDYLNIGIWLEENRGDVLIENNSFDNIIPFGTSPGRGVRIYNQVHPSYTAAAGLGAGGAPLEFGTQAIRDCTFNLPYGGVAVLCDVGTPTPSGGTSRSQVTLEAMVATENAVNFVKGDDTVYNEIPSAFQRDSTAFMIRNLETNPLYTTAPSINSVNVSGNTVRASSEALQSGFYSGKALNGLNIAGKLNRISGYGAVKANDNTFQGLTSAVVLTEYSSVPGTVNPEDVDATHNLHYGVDGSLIYEYRPLEGQYVTITGSDKSQFDVESYEPFFVDSEKNELSFEEFFILDIYDAKTNQKIQSAYRFDKAVKNYIIDDLGADVDSVYFIAWKVEKGTEVQLTHVESNVKQQLTDDANFIPIPSQVYALASTQPSGADTFIFDLSTVNNNPYKNENNNNQYVIKIKQKPVVNPPEPEPEIELKPDLKPEPEPNPQPQPNPETNTERETAPEIVPVPTPKPPTLLEPPTLPINPEAIDPNDPPRYREPIPEELIPAGWRQIRVVNDKGEVYYTIMEEEVPLTMNPGTGLPVELPIICLTVSILACSGGFLIARKRDDL